ncbi:MAG: EamA family transporter RarD [Alphaproteobacteria bacterium]|nr:EamA family transporter RarD [Alphaproteobacteria bacterium]
MPLNRTLHPPMTPDIRSGFLAAIGAYVLWGFLPVYFKLLGDTPPLMILAHRIVWSVPTALLLIVAAGKSREAFALRHSPMILLGLLASGAAVAINWTIYIWAVTEGHILQGSLGYFINPLISFLFAALFFGERFSRLQMLAFVLAGLGVLNQAVVVGEFPWISLSLAVTFAIYGVIRKRIPVDSRVGFALEALWLAPFACAYLAFGLPPATALFGSGELRHVLLLLLAGPVTAAPLILFAIGARRLHLSTIAALQYIGPSLQFAIALAYGEIFTPAHAVTFGLIWAGVVIFTFAAWRLDRARAAAASRAT